MSRAALLFAAAALCCAQHRFAAVAGEHWRGAALAGDAVYAWGRTLSRFDVPSGKQHVIAEAHNGGFGEGGCVDESGTAYLQDGTERGPLVAIGTSGTRTEYDPETEMHDCLATTLLGHPGVLMMDYYAQLRFYEAPGLYQEVYSIYTPSRQAGLLRADVDGDGRMDIFTGNYWVRSPRSFELPWRLFAINVHHETPDAATMSLMLRGRELYAAQGHSNDGSVFRYQPRADPRLQWKETEVASGLHFPHAIASVPAGVLVAENSGAGSRLFFIRKSGPLERVGTTAGVHTALVIKGHVLLVGAESMEWWNPAEVKAR